MQQTIDRIGEVFMGLVDVLREEGLDGHCIGAGAVLTNLMRRSGFPDAYPLAVHVQVLNPKATELAKKAGWRMGEVEDHPEVRVVAIGDSEKTSTDKEWNGHLVVIVPNVDGVRHMMLDPTVTQANRGGFGINLVPVSVAVRDDFVSGQKIRQFEVNGSTLQYQALPGDESYKLRSNWDQLVVEETMTGRVLERLKPESASSKPQPNVIKPSSRIPEREKTPKDRAEERKRKKRKK